MTGRKDRSICRRTKNLTSCARALWHCRQRTFRVLIRMLSDLNRKFARRGADVECDICCSIPTQPVRSCAQCRRMVCRQCLNGYMASAAFRQHKACFYCRRTGVEMVVVEAADAALVAASRDKEGQLQVCCAMRLYVCMRVCMCVCVHGGVRVCLLLVFVCLCRSVSVHARVCFSFPGGGPPLHGILHHSLLLRAGRARLRPARRGASPGLPHAARQGAACGAAVLSFPCG